MKVKHKWYLNATRDKAYKQHAQEALSLYAIVGQEIKDEDAKRLGITNDEEPKSLESTACNKAIKPESKEAPKAEKADKE